MRDMIVYFSLFNLTLVSAWYHGMAHYALLYRLEESACGSVNALTNKTEQRCTLL